MVFRIRLKKVALSLEVLEPNVNCQAKRTDVVGSEVEREKSAFGENTPASDCCECLESAEKLIAAG
jgi:hypothetical protein